MHFPVHLAMYDFLRKLMSEQPSKFGLTFGRGVLGKTAPVIGVGLIALGGIAATIDNIWIQLAFGAGICAIALYYIREAFRYAHAFPNHALLEDAKLIQALKIEQAAKDKSFKIDPNAEPIPNPALIGGKRHG